MRHFFVVRNGNYDFSGDLNSVGEMQMDLMADTINKIVGQGTAYVLRSPHSVSIKSYTRLKPKLNPVGVEEIAFLWDNFSSSEDVDSYWRNPDDERLMQIVDERRDFADALIMLSHSQIIARFPFFFLNRERGIDKVPRFYGYGQGIYFDINSGNFRRLP